ncbi:MAG: type II toxin-antitoxin system RelE/ParE family toxin [Pseudomonadota bacterium]
MYTIEWLPKAYKQLRKIKDRKMANFIYDTVETLQNWPDCKNVKALVNHNYGYRLRVGAWRVFFDIKQHLEIIEIEEVKKRDEHAY